MPGASVGFGTKSRRSEPRGLYETLYDTCHFHRQRGSRARQSKTFTIGCWNTLNTHRRFRRVIRACRLILLESVDIGSCGRWYPRGFTSHSIKYVDVTHPLENHGTMHFFRRSSTDINLISGSAISDIWCGRSRHTHQVLGDLWRESGLSAASKHAALDTKVGHLRLPRART